MTSNSAIAPTYPFHKRGPAIEQRPASVLSPFGQRLDPYYGLRDDSRQDPEILAILTAQNEHCAEYFEPLSPLLERLTQELKSRIPAEEHSVPVWQWGRWWQSRFEGQAEYPLIVSGTKPDESDAEILFNPNDARGDNEFYALGSIELNPEENCLAVVEDLTGRREYQLRFIDRAGKLFAAEVITGIEPEVVWLPLGEILYIRKDPITLLGNRVMRHRVGTPVDTDVLVYAEEDAEFTLSIARSRSGRFVQILLDQTLTSEIRWARWDDRHLLFEVILPRAHGIEYSCEDQGDDVFLKINEDAAEFKLIKVPFSQRMNRSSWHILVPPRKDVFIDDFLVFENHIVTRERHNGRTRLMRVDLKSGLCESLTQQCNATTVDFDANEDASLSYVRYSSVSMAEPRSIWDIDLNSGERRKRFLQHVPHVKLNDYRTFALTVQGRDGCDIPVTVLSSHKNDSDSNPKPLLLTGYGAYGLSMDPYFKSTWISLVDRGVMVAIAHIRGGQELGRGWTEAGRRSSKMNTFNDFVDVTRAMAQREDVDASRIAAMGGSAGGLLMGAVVNQAPELYRAIVAQVPFVDVVTSMLDDGLPLTTNEYDEWGNPARSALEYHTLLSYSPIDQVKQAHYPAIYMTTGLYDSQVQYWEPLKWLAVLRDHQLGNAPLLLESDLRAGHGGKAGRFERVPESARIVTFLLNELGCAG